MTCLWSIVNSLLLYAHGKLAPKIILSRASCFLCLFAQLIEPLPLDRELQYSLSNSITIIKEWNFDLSSPCSGPHQCLQIWSTSHQTCQVVLLSKIHNQGNRNSQCSVHTSMFHFLKRFHKSCNLLNLSSLLSLCLFCLPGSRGKEKSHNYIWCYLGKASVFLLESVLILSIRRKIAHCQVIHNLCVQNIRNWG